MKKTSLLALLFAFSIALGGWSSRSIDFLKKKSLSIYSEKIIDNYKDQLNYLKLAKEPGYSFIQKDRILNLSAISGTVITESFLQTEEEKKEIDEAIKNKKNGVSDIIEKFEKVYEKEVKNIIISKRKEIFNFCNEENTYLFLETLSQELDKNSLDKKRFFEDMKFLTTFYIDNLKKLQKATPLERKIIFQKVKEISPREKAYMLQEFFSEGIWEIPDYKITKFLSYSYNKDHSFESCKSTIQSAKDLRSSAKSIGIAINLKCSDFHNYGFTRYSRQYDYLFSILRWATYIDKGNISEYSISGYKEETIKKIIDEGIVVLQKFESSLAKFNY